jgi:hypothetical protein
MLHQSRSFHDREKTTTSISFYLLSANLKMNQLITNTKNESADNKYKGTEGVPYRNNHVESKPTASTTSYITLFVHVMPRYK